MFAVIKTGGKQYSVAADDEIVVMTLSGEPGDDVTFDNVLMLVDGETTKFGAPFVEGAKVVGTIVGHERGAEGSGLQEAPPAELEAQARPPAGSDPGEDHQRRLIASILERLQTFREELCGKVDKSTASAIGGKVLESACSWMTPLAVWDRNFGAR